jgi:hypothetical protein
VLYQTIGIAVKALQRSTGKNDEVIELLELLIGQIVCIRNDKLGEHCVTNTMTNLYGS